MEVRVLGSIEVVLAGTPTEVTSRNQRVVLAALAARAGAVVPTEALVDALWPDGAPRSATTSLRTYVSRLRHLLGERIVGVPDGYRLDVADVGLDARRFDALVDQAAAASGADALALLDEALELWRGRPFGDVDDVELVRPAAVRLAERGTSAREARAAALLDVGRAADAVAAAEELLAAHPLRERAWAVLVRALGAAGRPTEALRAYQRAVEVLADAGLEPTAELRGAEAAALSGAGERPPSHRVALPASSLVGRAQERAAVAGALRGHRIVTLVGPGGVGKTRLARTVAADLADGYAAGVRVVELAGVEDGTRVPGVVAGALGLAVGAGGALAALATAGDLDLLVLLDCCEHVIDDAALAVAALVSTGGRLRVLATSREPLCVDGEQRWPLEPLPLDGGDGAPALFLDRARSVRPGLDIGPEDRALVIEVCRSLDGLPLAIEMAASALRSLPLVELAQRLRDDGGLPAAERRGADRRHSTLAGLVGWSTRLLDADDRELLHGLTVFAGRFTAADVAAVTGRIDPFDALCRLADRSLLVADPSGATARFRMLRTVRAALTDPDPRARARHAAWTAAAVAEADGWLRGPEERAGHDRMHELLDDVRRSLAWALEHDADVASRLVAHLALFGQTRQRDDVLEWATQLVDRSGTALSGRVGGAVLAAAAHRAVVHGDLAAGRALAERAVQLGDAGPPSLAHEVLSDLQLFVGELPASLATAQAGIDHATAAGDRHVALVCRVNAVLAAAYVGDHVAAEAHVRAAGDVSDASPTQRAWLRYAEGERLLDRDPERALAALDDAVALARSVGNRYTESVALVSSASVRSRTGDADAARSAFGGLIDHWLAQGDRTHLLTALRNLVVLLHRLGRDEQAAELLGSVVGDAVAPTFGDEERLLAAVADRLRASMGEDELRQRTSLGAGRDVADAARLARAWVAGTGDDEGLDLERG